MHKALKTNLPSCCRVRRSSVSSLWMRSPISVCIVLYWRVMSENILYLTLSEINFALYRNKKEMHTSLTFFKVHNVFSMINMFSKPVAAKVKRFDFFVCYISSLIISLSSLKLKSIFVNSLSVSFQTPTWRSKSQLNSWYVKV